ncbi:3389_t:CDS:2 [Paraglomus brasilianum]|uniref:Tyrosine--tRNA ligase n=1 Tax=Paraglomus brasilianum TaxID=144538 RepID=A0A9N9BHU9_9GLOM|nr:3389_t:CDS:2 [Paraglomus brasilianum]
MALIPIFIQLGGATGSIGDPSGHSTERQPLSSDTIRENVTHIETQVRKFFHNGVAYATRRGVNVGLDSEKEVVIINNIDWIGKMTAIELLSDVGRYVRVSSMLAKDSVRSRIRRKTDQGISFTEFSYQLLQAYDFWHLYNTYNCQIQLGGSDQWGNITAGIDLIQKKKAAKDESLVEENKEACGITLPLLVNSRGEKFGKSAGNPVWLREDMTSSYDFYQFFIRMPDSDVGKHLKMLTLLDIEEIDNVMELHEKTPGKYIAQEKLASEITELVHGEEALKRAQLATSLLFGTSDLNEIKAKDLIHAFRNDTRLKFLPESDVIDNTIDKVATLSGACGTRSEANKMIKARGLYLNKNRMIQPTYVISRDDLIDERLLLFRVGRNSYTIVAIEKQ